MSKLTDFTALKGEYLKWHCITTCPAVPVEREYSPLSIYDFGSGLLLQEFFMIALKCPHENTLHVWSIPRLPCTPPPPPPPPSHHCHSFLSPSVGCEVHSSFLLCFSSTDKCHFPSSLMKKVRECSAQSHLVPPPSLSLSGFRATCAKHHSDRGGRTAAPPRPPWNSIDARRFKVTRRGHDGWGRNQRCYFNL